MSYYNSDTKEFMVAALHHHEYPCIPIYDCINDQYIADEINNYVIRINKDNQKNKDYILNLENKIKNLQNKLNQFIKEKKN